MNLAWVILYFCVELGNAALGWSHSRCELIFFNQTLREAVDQALQSVLKLETLGFKSLDIVQGSARSAASFIVAFQPPGIPQTISHLAPHRRFQKLARHLGVVADS